MKVTVKQLEVLFVYKEKKYFHYAKTAEAKVKQPLVWNQNKIRTFCHIQEEQELNRKTIHSS